jgi:hypothetical protein
MLLAGEETAVVREVLAAGHAGWWVPEARVRHFVLADRQSLRYLRDYYAGNARSAAWIALTSAPDAPLLFGRPRWIWRQAVTSELRYRLQRLTGASSARWSREFRRASEAWGLLRAIDADLLYWARLESERRAEAARESRRRTDVAARVGDARPPRASSGRQPVSSD